MEAVSNIEIKQKKKKEIIDKQLLFLNTQRLNSLIFRLTMLRLSGVPWGRNYVQQDIQKQRVYLPLAQLH